MSKKDMLDDVLESLEDDSDNDLDLEDDNLKALKSDLADKDKQIAGLLKEAKAQRRKKQETEKRLDKLTETVNNVLSQRPAPAADIKTADETIADVIKGDYDDDGNPVIKADALKALQTKEITALNEKIANLEAILQASTQSQQQEAEGAKIVDAIVGSDERFGPAYRKYQTARKWVEDKVIEYQNENNIPGYMTSGQALDYVFDNELEKEFNDAFPNIDLERVVTAEDSQRHLKATLASIAEPESPKMSDEEGQRLQRLMRKPGGLGQNADKKGGQPDLLDRLQSLSTEDLMGISDAQEAQILKALAQQENR